MANDIAKGMKFLHGRGIMHRDSGHEHRYRLLNHVAVFGVYLRVLQAQDALLSETKHWKSLHVVAAQ
eukprot:6453166-Amphidinium_carterae.1